MTNDDSRLDDLFRRYGAFCPDVEPSAGFMTGLWQKIEARHSFWFVFQRLARAATTACAALCLLLLVLNFVSAPQNHARHRHLHGCVAGRSHGGEDLLHRSDAEHAFRATNAARPSSTKAARTAESV